MSARYPAAVRKQNDLLRAELGENPRYAWRWSEELVHVLEVLDLDGKPIFVEGRSQSGLVTMVPKTAIKKLLPDHHDQWVVCALVEVNANDGLIQGTGKAAWVPLASPGGVVCLPENEVPNNALTESVISAVREHRNKSIAQLGENWETQQAKNEKDRWNRIYDEIRDASTAFANVPGMKAHVSFPSVH